ncbi:helix-turn-helix transcriptional regulator [Pseudomonas putida]|nr:helix-turn-helix transcriptional regulator [Pseudomonas putida]
MALGERIARLRKEHGITQTQLAERLGVSRQPIQAYESGKRRIQVAALPEPARLLSTTYISTSSRARAFQMLPKRYPQKHEAPDSLLGIRGFALHMYGGEIGI